jgi:flagellar protein FlgJ
MKKVSKQFESIFLRMLLKEMRSTVEKDPLSGNDRAMEMFQSMQDDQFADTMSEKGIGIGDMVYRQMMSDTLKNSQKMGSKPI